MVKKSPRSRVEREASDTTFEKLFETPTEIKMITVAAFFHVFKQKKVKLFSVFLKNVEKTLKFKQRIDSVTKLFLKLYEFFELFFWEKKYRFIDFTTTKSN